MVTAGSGGNTLFSGSSGEKSGNYGKGGLGAIVESRTKLFDLNGTYTKGITMKGLEDITIEISSNTIGKGGRGGGIRYQS